MTNIKDVQPTLSLFDSKKPSMPAMRSVAQSVAQLPPNPEFWMPSQVALYLTHVLGVTPKPIVEDVTSYVRQSRMAGRQFLRIREQDLADEGVNLKWRKLMVEAVKKLRKDCVRNRIWPLDYMGQWDNEMHRQTPLSKSHEAQSKDTLKRLRDKKAVRDMITNFENISESNISLAGDDGASPGRLQKRDSISSLNSVTSSSDSPRPHLVSFYGSEGHVQDHAATFNVRPADSEVAQGAPLSRTQLENWFGDLTEDEAEALADELDAHEQESGHLSASSSQSSYLSTSEGSSTSSPQTPSLDVHSGFDLTPIDADIVMTIVHLADAPERSQAEPLDKVHDSSPMLVEPLQKDDLLGEDEQKVSRQMRPLKNNGRTNPYRMSTYDDEDVAALGLYEGRNTLKFETARRITLDNEESLDVGAAGDSIRIRTNEGVMDTSAFKDLFTPQIACDATQEDKISAPSSTEHSNNAKIFLAEEAEMDIVKRTPPTYGRTALAAALRAQQIQTSPESDMNARKAENESEWGVTVSRKASRRGTAARNEVKRLLPSVEADDTRYNTAASRMSALFSPSVLTELAPCQPDVDDVSDQHEDQILLPLATLDIEANGSASLRKKSMVLVDRRKFEALSKRMGDLEAQLADMEAASNATMSTSPSNAAHPRLRTIFDGNQQAQQSRSGADKKQDFDEDEENHERDWNLALRFGLIPSYGESRLNCNHTQVSNIDDESVSDFFRTSSPASKNIALGLAAGAGFVLLSEVFGRGRR
jgi:hypothetical protein